MTVPSQPTRVQVVTSPADPEAPTVAELEAGFDLTKYLAPEPTPACDHPVTVTDHLSLFHRGQEICRTTHKVTVCIECGAVTAPEADR